VDVHTRLHKEVKKETKGEVNSFIPQIDKKSVKMIQSKRDMKIDDLLVDDAKKRQERKGQMEKKFLDEQKLNKEETQKNVSKRSQKFIYSRFHSDWQHAIQESEQEEGAQLKQTKAIEIMSIMGFATENPSERYLIDEAWILLNKAEEF